MTEERRPVPGIFDRAFLTGVEGVTEVYLVRHGEQHVPDWTNAKREETYDPPLSTRGREQARLVGEALSIERIDRVYSSTMERARHTGREIARHHRLEVEEVDDLKEVGIFTRLPDGVEARDRVNETVFRGIRERMLREKSWDVYPHSESSHEFRRRTINAIEGIIALNEGRRVVVACHGGVINAYIGHIVGSPYDMFFRPAHTSINVVAAGEGLRALHRLNDVHHLQTRQGSFVSH
ncbi:MAG: histidine phosphatase family protein [Dehalococcoidia bacterium]|nr:histidine phosphatase family protein [Dehalococcoidia bacterium]MCA9844243.1 histidine phosphatase family protein [Dehalococcoidia bacterium]